MTDETRRGGNRLDQPEYLANIAESLDTKYRRGRVSWDQEITADVDFRLAYAFADIDRDSFMVAWATWSPIPRRPAMTRCSWTATWPAARPRVRGASTAAPTTRCTTSTAS